MKLLPNTLRVGSLNVLDSHSLKQALAGMIVNEPEIAKVPKRGLETHAQSPRQLIDAIVGFYRDVKAGYGSLNQ